MELLEQLRSKILDIQIVYIKNYLNKTTIENAR